MSDTPANTRDYSLIFSTKKEPAVKGERRELWQALKSLNNYQRILLLNECCKLANRGNPHVEPDTKGELHECYNDLTTLVVLHGASWDKIATKAVEFAAGKGEITCPLVTSQQAHIQQVIRQCLPV